MINVRNYVIFSLIMTALGLISFLFVKSFWLLFFLWFFRTIGNGVVGHRYFAHSQFVVGPITRKVFAYYTSISGYSTPLYWIVQHTHHHRNSDLPSDVHSPKNGILNSMFLWIFKPSVISSVFSDRNSKVMAVRAMQDKDVMNASKHFYAVNILFYSLLLCISTDAFFAWSAGFIIELLKYGFINSVLHLKLPGNYRNHNLKDDSQNNYLLGFITLGFGWHNNHHADAKKLDLQEKWWEFDAEAKIGKFFARVLRF